MVAASTVGTSYTGSANADTFVATVNIDIINSGNGNDVITGLAGADRINVGVGTDTVVYTDVTQTTELATPATLVSGVTVIKDTVDVITGMSAGDIIDLSGVENSYTGAAATTIAGGAGNTVAIVRGNYNATSGIWTTSTTGADSILVFDADATSVATVTDFVVLVGFVGVASTAAAGVITLA
jgi:Ca2+-binding RTX toxin-like protein